MSRKPFDLPMPVIYYIRHGMTDWNLEQRLQGRHDVPLNREGRAQAVRCGDILRDLLACDGRAPRDLAYVSSPLIRARRTMELVRSTLGLSPNGFPVDARLVEIAFGEWEGLTYEEINARDADVITRREASKWDFLPPGGESYAQVALRMHAWYRSLRQDTVVAAHGGTARSLIAHLAIAVPEQATQYPIEQGVVYRLVPGQLVRFT